MALIVEDGTGVAGAESYVEVAEADAQLDAEGCYSWATLQTVEKEASLRRAAKFIEQQFQLNWKGERASALQSLSWPRVDVMAFGEELPANYIPPALKSAQISMAFKAAAGELNPDLTTGVVKEKVDVIEVEYDSSKTGPIYRRALSQTLAPYLKNVGGLGFSQVRVVRV